MDQATVTSLTTAFDLSDLVATFVLLAPYILSVAGIIIGISLVKWGVKLIRRKLSGGVA